MASTCSVSHVHEAEQILPDLLQGTQHSGTGSISSTSDGDVIPQQTWSHEEACRHATAVDLPAEWTCLPIRTAYQYFYCDHGQQCQRPPYLPSRDCSLQERPGASMCSNQESLAVLGQEAGGMFHANRSGLSFASPRVGCSQTVRMAVVAADVRCKASILIRWGQVLAAPPQTPQGLSPSHLQAQRPLGAAPRFLARL